jgi:thiamine-phosphate pyrophosphorylase
VISGLPRLFAVTDDRVVGQGRVVERAREMAAAAGGELAVELRSRSLGGRALLLLARQLAAALEPKGAWLVLNDRCDVARAARARAVVSGRSGLLVADVRRAAPGVQVGRSVHDQAEARSAAREGADFLIAGAVYETASHPDRAPAGLEVVKAAAATGKPVIAIGGITPERAAPVLDAGAYGLAAIRALWDAARPAAEAEAFLSALPRRDTVAVTVNGERRLARAGTTLAGLLADLALDPRAVVVEHNRAIVRREALAGVVVGEGDAIELVHFVGGG